MALQNLCLSAIAFDFPRYYEAFQTSKEPHMKQMLEFLQRVYSFQLAQQIFEITMQRRYTDFLMNKYLKILDTTWFENDAPWESIVAKIAVIGPSLQKIEFYGHRPWKELFCFLPNLEVMHYQRICNNEILSSVAKFCPNIIEIDIRHSHSVTEEGFLSLCKKKNGESSCPKLKNLLLRGCEVTDAVVVHLIKNFPLLEVFDYHNIDGVLYSMHKEDLDQLDKIPPYNFIELNLLSDTCLPYFTDVLKVCSSLCPFVTNLLCDILESQHLDLLSGLSHLEVLELHYEQEDFLDINYFLKSSGSKLTSLKIYRCSLSVLTLAESCPALRRLTLKSINFEQLEGPIPLFHNLETFGCEYMELSVNYPNNVRSVCAILSFLPKLRDILFIYSNLTAIELKTGILKCCEHCCVEKIQFLESHAEKTFVIDVLLSCHSLKQFGLFNCGLDVHDELEIHICARNLPNKPFISF